MADSAPLLKNQFGIEFVEGWAERLVEAGNDIDVSKFVSSTMAGYDDLTFTKRSVRLAESLHQQLGDDFPRAIDAVLGVLPGQSPPTDEGTMEEGFWMWPIGDFIRLFGTVHFDESMEACYQLTKRFTAEFAIRPFLADDFERALPYLQRWVNDPNEHVRRLVSEGTRPRLPWASRLQLPVNDILDVLAVLRADESLYVRRSVANHLNDLAKDHSDTVLTLLENWHAEGNEHTTWIVRHALRNHFKNGDVRALAMMGYEAPDVEVKQFDIESDEVAVGDNVVVAFDVVNRADRDQKLMIDLVMGYQKANGSLQPKVFKFKDVTVARGETMNCVKKFLMVQRSTRKLYPGEHNVAIQINGVDYGELGFVLTG